MGRDQTGTKGNRFSSDFRNFSAKSACALDFVKVLLWSSRTVGRRCLSQPHLAFEQGQGLLGPMHVDEQCRRATEQLSREVHRVLSAERRSEMSNARRNAVKASSRRPTYCSASPW
jgi:hypothetical protein